VNTPQPSSLQVNLDGALTATILNAFSVLGLNFIHNQPIDNPAWGHVLLHEGYIRSLTEMCVKAYKIEPPAKALDLLKQVIAQPRTIANSILGAALCLGAMHGLSRVMAQWTEAATQELMAKKAGEQAPPEDKKKGYH
jgi:hypothetical protein